MHVTDNTHDPFTEGRNRRSCMRVTIQHNLQQPFLTNHKDFSRAVKDAKAIRRKITQEKMLLMKRAAKAGGRA